LNDIKLIAADVDFFIKTEETTRYLWQLCNQQLCPGNISFMTMELMRELRLKKLLATTKMKVPFVLVGLQHNQSKDNNNNSQCPPVHNCHETTADT